MTSANWCWARFWRVASSRCSSKQGRRAFPSSKREKAILGVEHAEIGGRVLAQWNFPENLVNAVRHHHNPAQARPHEQLAAYVHLGDIIAHCLGQAQGYESFAVRTQAEALQILEISPKEIDDLGSRNRRRFERMPRA